MSDMLFHHDEDLSELARSSTDYLAGRSLDPTAGFELGWPGIGVAEARGGSGGDRTHVAVVLEAAGATTAAAPLGLTAAVVHVLADLHDDRSRGVLSEVAQGARRVVFPASDPRSVAGTLAEGSGSFLAYGTRDASIAVLPTSGGLALVDLASPGIEMEEVKAMDVSRPLFRVRVSDIDAASVVGDAGTVDRLTSLAAFVIAADSAGIARSALRRTLTFSKEREQFGRPIASFQAYKHRCADLYIDVRIAQAGVMRTARDPDLGIAFEVAMDVVRRATRVAADAVQLHGAMGFSWESGMHLLLKRARANELFWQPTMTSLDGPANERQEA